MIVPALLAVEDGLKPAQEGVFDFSAPEMALFALGVLATLAALAVGVWLYVRAVGEERERAEQEKKR